VLPHGHGSDRELAVAALLAALLVERTVRVTTVAASAVAVPRTAGRREAEVARTAIAVVALHVVDDNFLQPQPGTSAADHLVSGLVPLASLGATAVYYRRLRAGLRAVLVVVVGLFAVVGGAGEAGYYTVKVGPSGDDFTGLLMLAAGFVLLGLGAVILWRTRRRDERRLRRYARRALIVVVAAVAFILVLFPLTSAYVYTHAARAVVPTARLGAPHEDVTLKTSDGLRLRGWYVASRNGAAVIAFPGRSGPQRPTRMLARHGYGVLLFDRRGEGESDGDPNALGWAGDRDLDAAIAFLGNRPDVEANRIGGIGLSVGGEMLLDRAADSSDLRAVVSDGAGIRSAREATLGSGVNRWFGLPFWTMTTAGVALFANDLPPPSLKELVPKISPRSIFLIYAGHGRGGEGLTSRYFEAAGEPKTLWKIPEAGHTGGIMARPAEYERRMITFFDQALKVND
jgi:uncharacterized protein